MSIFGSMEFHSNMISFSRSQPETFPAEPINSRKPSGETLDFQFGQNMEDNSETLKETFNSETQSPLFDEFFFNLNATPLTTKHPENSMHPVENSIQTTVATDANKSPAKSKSSKKPRRRRTKEKPQRRGRKESTVKLGLMEGPDLPEWLPQGWQLERKRRENGVKTGMLETFYYDPEKGRQFRSKSEVLLFLESGTRMKRAPRRPKEILAGPTNNFNIPAQASTSKSCIDRQLELAPHVSSIDALAEWLPQGWQLERKRRETGVKTGMVETFYYDPEKGRQFRSKREVLLFLESGTRMKRAPRRPKEILAGPRNNFNIPTQASTSKSYINNQLELAPHVSSIDANRSGNLNPVIGNETVPKQTMDDQNADFEERVSKPDSLDDGIVQTPARPTVMIESFEKSNSVKSWRRSGAVGTSLKLGIIEGVDLPEWLPQGWKMERKVRQSGASAGMIDAVYTDPEKGHKFLSKVGVLRYLETGIHPIHPKRAKPSNNLKPSTRRKPSSKRRKTTASTTDITDQAELGSQVQNLDADSFGSLNPLVGDETVAEQTMHDRDADFTITEVGTSFQS